MKILRFALGALLLITPPLPAQDPGLVIEGGTLIDGTGRPPVENVTIVVEGNRIRSISTGPIRVPEGAQRVNGRGKYVIPGLMDVHVHLRGGRSSKGAPDQDEQAGIRALHGYLYSGVTTIYDAGNNPDHILLLREKERSGQIVSPRIFATGSIVTAPGGHGGPSAVTVEDWARDRPKLDAHIARKPDILKITQDEHGWGTRPMINFMPVELLEKIIRYYNEHGIRTTIHTSNELRSWEAIYAGIDTLAHPVIQAPVSEKYLNMMKVKKVPQVSTLTIGEGYSRLVEHPEFLDQPLYQATLAPNVIDRLRNRIRNQWEERRWTQWMKVMTPVAQENLRKLNEVGGIVALGTDQSLGPAVHRELELLVAGGISPLDAIKIGTQNAAIFLGREHDMGTVEAGKLADLVLLDADPSQDIDNTKRIHLVIKDGHIIERSGLQIPANARATP
ncbi:MAG: amidohydrolase family protein [Acidobacteriota bacterium]